MEDITVTPITNAPQAGAPLSGDVPVPLQSFFHLDTPTKDQSEQLKTIWDYFEGNEVERLYKIKQLENRLGMPPLGQTRFAKMYEYVKLTNHIKDVEKLRDAL